MELKDTWPEIIKNQRLGQGHHRNNRRRENRGSKFWQQKLYLHKRKTAS